MNGTHAREIELGLGLILPVISWKEATQLQELTQAPHTRTLAHTPPWAESYNDIQAFCTAPPSVLLGHEVCKWRVIRFIHSGADQLYGNVCYRTISIVKSTASPNTQDREGGH